jgi:hypothetical protein
MLRIALVLLALGSLSVAAADDTPWRVGRRYVKLEALGTSERRQIKLL